MIQRVAQSLEMTEGGTWSELAAAHRDLVPGPTSPSGLANRYSIVPYTFPATLQLTGLGAISDALVGRVKWTNPAVLLELNELVLPTGDINAEWLKQWRKRAAETAIAMIKRSLTIEEAVFGDASVQKRSKPVPVQQPAEPVEMEGPVIDHY
ncbi:hypothetical protein BP00DRAFT_336966 [Aspergillus indologenus CBS 114.80]|uniref:Uncharacterized protein n=1 Tax=Aspergillus indologenus CBS 114.80 TaxID=1450541 RepID=A0A2V5IZ73_9EURO|nr:hypothetical protein BP00DRAFT_336966 [Aspergillus indologenus CBS 114.80]